MKLSGNVAVVTGASRGIGREVALELGREGVKLALLARNAGQLDALAATIGRDQCLVTPVDLAEPAAAERAFQQVLSHWGRVDILVNNAAVTDSGDFLTTSVEDIARVADLNYRAAVVLARLAAEDMARRGRGHIVNVASLAGVSGVPGAAVYAGTKAALRLLTSSLRPELRAHGITLTDVVLGFVETDMLDQAEDNPRVERFFRRARQLRLMVDTPAPVVGRAIVRAIERQQEVVVLPTRSRYLTLPLQGITRLLPAILSR